MHITSTQYLRSLLNAPVLDEAARERLREGIQWIYHLGGYAAPVVLFVPSFKEGFWCAKLYEYWLENLLYSRFPEINKARHRLVNLFTRPGATGLQELTRQTVPFTSSRAHYTKVPLKSLVEECLVDQSVLDAIGVKYFLKQADFGPKLQRLNRSYRQAVKLVQEQDSSETAAGYYPHFRQPLLDALRLHLSVIMPHVTGIGEPERRAVLEDVDHYFDPVYRQFLSRQSRASLQNFQWVHQEWLHELTAALLLMREKKLLRTERTSQYLGYFGHSDSIAEVYAYDSLCIVVSGPTQMQFRDNQLHNAIGPAVVWPDGKEQYFWRGQSVPERLIREPEKVTREEVLSLDNAEMRRAYREALGTERYAGLLGLVELDRDTAHGQEVVLLRTAEKDPLLGELEPTGQRDRMARPVMRPRGEYLYFVQVSCHSTGRQYLLGVPPEAATNAWAALAWTFGKTAQEYRPAIET